MFDAAYFRRDFIEKVNVSRPPRRNITRYDFPPLLRGRSAIHAPLIDRTPAGSTQGRRSRQRPCRPPRRREHASRGAYRLENTLGRGLVALTAERRDAILRQLEDPPPGLVELRGRLADDAGYRHGIP